MYSFCVVSHYFIITTTSSFFMYVSMSKGRKVYRPLVIIVLVPVLKKAINTTQYFTSTCVYSCGNKKMLKVQQVFYTNYFRSSTVFFVYVKTLNRVLFICYPGHIQIIRLETRLKVIHSKSTPQHFSYPISNQEKARSREKVTSNDAPNNFLRNEPGVFY